MLPARRKRTPAIINGGKLSIAMRIPRYVEPQIKYSEIRANPMLIRSLVENAGAEDCFVSSRRCSSSEENACCLESGEDKSFIAMIRY